MADGHGGYRQPANPAVISNPGAGSARTDGGVMNPNSPSYGEGATLETMKAGAPLAGAGGASAPAPGGAAASLLDGVTGLGAPSMSGDPVTSGAAMGAGPGVDALGLPQDATGEDRADREALGPAALQALVAASTREDATPSFRRLVRSVLYS